MISQTEIEYSSSIVESLERALMVFAQNDSSERVKVFDDFDIAILVDTVEVLTNLFEGTDEAASKEREKKTKDDKLLEAQEYEIFLCRKLPWVSHTLDTMEAIGYEWNCFHTAIDVMCELIARHEVDEDEYDFAEDFCYRLNEEIKSYIQNYLDQVIAENKPAEAEPAAEPQNDFEVEKGLQGKTRVSSIARDQTLRILVELAAILDVEIDTELLVGIALEELRPTLKLIELFSGESALTETRTRDEAENFILLYRLEELVTEDRLQEVTTAIMASRIMNMHHAVGVYLADTDLSIEEAGEGGDTE